MKKADIKLGVVYAYQRSSHCTPEPVVFLSTDLYTSRSRIDRTGPWAVKSDPGYKLGRDYLGSSLTGYPVAVRDHSNQVSSVEELIPQMLALTPSDWEGSKEGRKGAVRFAIQTSLRQITGVYAEVMAERKEEIRRMQELADELEQEERESRQRALAVVTALSNSGIKVGHVPAYGHIAGIPIPLEEAEKLVRLLGWSDT